MYDTMNMGGLSNPGYATIYNTPGIGDVIPCGINTAGSGDRFDSIQPKKNSKNPKAANKSTKPEELTPPLIVYC